MNTKSFIIAVFLSCYLGIPSSSNAQPLGTIMAYSLDAYVNRTSLESDGWWVCDGSRIKKSDCQSIFDQLVDIYGKADEDIAYLPDLRGMFLRGVHQGGDESASNSIVEGSKENRYHPKHSIKPLDYNSVGSLQNDTLKSHQHETNARSVGGPILGGGHPFSSLGPVANITPFGGTETRPKNAYVYWIIKVK